MSGGGDWPEISIDDSCIICQIVAGEAPSSNVNEDGACLAFMVYTLSAPFGLKGYTRPV